MLAYIKGKLVSADESLVVVETGGIGYQIFVSYNTIVKLPAIGEDIHLFTFMNVKDDGINLFGFHSSEEKNMFLKLISISGIGPKSGMSILSGMDLSSLAMAIIGGDTKTLSKIKGLGKKTAERIVLELKGKLGSEHKGLDWQGEVFAGSQDNGMVADAISALQSLGISEGEAYKAVMAVKGSAKTVEELISAALKVF